MFMRQRRALRMTLAAVTIAGSAAVVGVVGAPPALATSAPSCVVPTVTDGGHTVKATNTCRYAYRVKIVWAYATDSPCTYLSPNHYFTDHKGWPARFDGLVLC